MDLPLTAGWRRHALLNKPLPPEWSAYIDGAIRHFGSISASERKTVSDTARILVDEKSWEGCGGLELTDEIKLTIAANAAVLVLGFPNYYFPNVFSILVYPAAYNVPDPNDILRPSMSIGVPRTVLGQSFGNGPVILSWEDVRHDIAGKRSGGNVVIHEFAHKLDQADGSADGVPYLRESGLLDRWASVMSTEYANLVAAVRGGHDSVIDSYGATNAAEFFAVVTETFFVRPHSLRDAHPDLYDIFTHYYRQDPAARTEATP